MNPDTHHRLRHALCALEFIAEDCKSFLDGKFERTETAEFIRLIRDFAASQHEKLSSEQS